MKKILLFVLPVLLFSCTGEAEKSAKNLSKEEKKKIYLETGQDYMDKKISSLVAEGKDDVLSVKLLTIDSISKFSEQTIAKRNMDEYYSMYDMQLGYVKELLDADAQANGVTESTQAEMQKADQMETEYDALTKKFEAASTKQIGELVTFSIKIVKEDGSTATIPFPIAFNDDMTVNAKYMDLLFD